MMPPKNSHLPGLRLADLFVETISGNDEKPSKTLLSREGDVSWKSPRIPSIPEENRPPASLPAGYSAGFTMALTV